MEATFPGPPATMHSHRVPDVGPAPPRTMTGRLAQVLADFQAAPAHKVVFLLQKDVFVAYKILQRFALTVRTDAHDTAPDRGSGFPIL